MIAEELFHFIWQFRLFNQLGLRSTDNEQVYIHYVGEYNSNAGPDFLHARLTIAGQAWHGSIELHVDGKDWMLHKHHLDEAYNSVILHVVFKHAVTVYRADGTPIPCLVLGEYLEEHLLTKYRRLMDNRQWISCEAHLSEVGSLTTQMAKDRMLVERMEQRYQYIKSLHEETKADWERILFLLLCRSFGMKVNADAFMWLGRLIDLNLLRKYGDDPLKQEALFFGQAGLLSADLTDKYGRELYAEYDYLQKAHPLAQVKAIEWKYLRMRPVNFPSFRMGQLVGVYGANPYLFADLLACSSIEQAVRLCDNSRTSVYWKEHYRFDKLTPRHQTKLSTMFVYHVLINAFVPVLFAYGKLMGEPLLTLRALDWLTEIRAEDNHIIRMFGRCGVTAANAADSQALLHLKQRYCDKKRCLECAICLSILKC